MGNSEKVIGILALQGDFEAHAKTFHALQCATRTVRTVRELDQVDALILPGGESTTVGKLMKRFGLDTAIQERAHAGMPIFGTCAGLILLSKRVQDYPDQPTLGLLDATVARNAFGRQVDSFEAEIPFTFPSEPATEVHGVFIRAPYLTEVDPQVTILARYQDKIVGVREGALLGIAFHPELTTDTRVHEYFAQMVVESSEQRTR